MMSLSLTLAEVYSEHAENDGFLYVTYASQEVFGSNIDYFSYENRGLFQDTPPVVWEQNNFY